MNAAGTGDNRVGGTGTITPRGGTVRLVGVPGYQIKRIFVQAGQTVRKGTPLLELDGITADSNLADATIDLEVKKKDAEYRTDLEAATLKLMDTKLQHAKRDATNYKSVGPGGTSEKELSRLQQAVEEAQINLDIEKLRAQQLQYDLVNGVRAAAIRRDASKAAADHFVVRAPTDGTVLKIYHTEGDQAGGDPLIDFGDLSTMFVEAQIYQGDLMRVKPGMKATVKNSAFPNLGAGRVETVGRIVGTRTQLGDVRIRLDKNDPADRLVGMEVEVVIGQ